MLDLPNLETSRRHFALSTNLAYPSAFKKSQRWSHWSKMAADAIEQFTSPREAIAFAQRKLGFEHRHSVANSKSHWPRYERALLEAFPNEADLLSQIADTPLSDTVTTTEFHGRLMSSMMFWHAHEFLATITRVAAPARIVEIGGGYGSLARLWFEHGPRQLQYWLTDLPESLFFSEVFLREHFPAIPLHYALDPKDVSSAEPTAIILIPAQAAARFRNIVADIVINSGSMQEMPDDTMLWWCGWIEDNQFEHFYSLNYGLQPIAARRGGSANWMCPRLGPYWDALLLRLDPPIVREQSLRHFREVFYRRVPPNKRDPNERARHANDILARHDTPVSIHREQAVLELLDAMRLAPNKRLGKKLVEILSQHYDYRPKELVHVCRYCTTLDDLTAEERALVDTTLELLSKDAAEEHDGAIPTVPLY
jgi:putative sugar O-methyltransferase